MYLPFEWRSPGKEEIHPTREERDVLKYAGADTPKKYGLKVDNEFDPQDISLLMAWKLKELSVWRCKEVESK
jgi:hypothetical protein